MPRPHYAAYTAAKHGVTGLTKATALDGRPFGIACGQIDIGNADTAMAGKMKKGVPQADGSIAVEPVIDVQCVVQAVLYMAGLPLDTNVPTSPSWHAPCPTSGGVERALFGETRTVSHQADA